MIDERLIPLNDAAAMLPRPGGRAVSKISLWRWATKGIGSPRLPAGCKARLDTIKLGATRYTSVEALTRFAALLDGRPAAELVPQVANLCHPRAPAHRRAACRRAEAELRAGGFMDAKRDQGPADREQRTPATGYGLPATTYAADGGGEGA